MVPLIKIRMMRAFRVQLPFNATVLALFSVVWVWGILGKCCACKTAPKLWFEKMICCKIKLTSFLFQEMGSLLSQ